MKAYLFITCLVYNLLPQIEIRITKIRSEQGVVVEFARSHTCCGQPAFNSGYTEDTKAVARQFIKVFKSVIDNSPSNNSYIICPSGSCVSMVKVYYRELFKDEPLTLDIIDNISCITYEFTDFLVNVLKITDVGAEFEGTATYHDSCHMLRELRVRDAPRELMKAVKGLRLIEMEMSDACCGFGGTFSVKFPEVSVSMLDEKLDCIMKSGADAVVSADMGCLMNIGGAISRRSLPVRVMHIAELLAAADSKVI